MPAGFQPVLADAFGLDVHHGLLEVVFQIDLSVGHWVQTQDMARHGQVNGMGGILGGTAANQPGVILLQQADILFRPVAGWARARRLGRQALIAGIVQGLVVAPGNGGGGFGRPQDHPSSF